MVAAKVGNVKIVSVLLRYGADPTYITDAGETALSIGAKVKLQTEYMLLKSLVRAQQLNPLSGMLFISLHNHSQHHDEKLIEILIDYGADIGTALCMSGLNRPCLKRKHRRKTDNLNEANMGFSHYGFSFEPILILSQPKFLLMTRNPVLEAFKVGSIINKIGTFSGDLPHSQLLCLVAAHHRWCRVTVPVSPRR